MKASRRALLRACLAAGIAPAVVRRSRADEARFALGVASGHPHPTGVVLWTRLLGEPLPDEVAVRWEISEDESFTRIAARGVETARRDDAHCVHAEPAGLRPGRWYWYRFEALGVRSGAGRTRTAPAPDAEATLDFAIASCQRWDHGHYAAWRHAVDERLDLVIFLGDYIYEYPFVPGRVRAHEGGYVVTLEQYRARYAQYKSDPALQAAHAAQPWLMVWDDHEVENDYAGMQGEVLRLDFAARRAAAYRAYWEHMPFPKAARPMGPAMRIHGRHDWGRLARIHALDDRQYRDPHACSPPGRAGSTVIAARRCEALADPRRSLLGAEQERWLAEGWDPQRGWNLVAQQTLMARASRRDPAREPTYWTDGWDGYPAARERLLRSLHERGVRNAVVLGGDVHATYVADLKPDFDDPRSPVVASEFCGTSISSAGPRQAAIDRVLPHNPHIRYGAGEQHGYLRFRLDARGLQAAVRVVDDVGDPVSGIRTAARFVVEAGSPGVRSG